MTVSVELRHVARSITGPQKLYRMMGTEHSKMVDGHTVICRDSHYRSMVVFQRFFKRPVQRLEPAIKCVRYTDNLMPLKGTFTFE